MSTNAAKLVELRRLLQGLPNTLPIPAQPHYSFVNYCPDEDKVELYGDIPSAINNTLEISFGFKARSEGDKIIAITERGPGICAVVDVLELYQKNVKDPEDAILSKWIDDLRAGAEKAYRMAGAEPVLGKKRSREPSVITIDEDSDDTPASKTLRYEDLVEVSTSVLDKKKAGRPKDVANTTLSIVLVHKVTGKQYYRCVAEKCKWVRAGTPQRNRLLKHSTSCIYLSAGLKLKAEDWSSADSLGGKVGVLPDPDSCRDASSAPSSDSTGPASKRPRLADFGGESSSASLGSCDSPAGEDDSKQPSVEEQAIAAGRKKLKRTLNHLVLKLICKAQIVFLTPGL